MTIDAFDWLHRTGENPPDEPSTDPAPTRRRGPSSTRASSPTSTSTCSSPTRTRTRSTGSTRDCPTTRRPSPATSTRCRRSSNRGYDNHIQCFLGYLRIATPFNTIPREACGPENSLTLWGDQGDAEILADYGAAYSMMEFLAGRYGVEFLSALHDDDANGFEGLQAVLDARHVRTTSAAVLHDWAAMIALDGVLDDGATAQGR